MHIVPNSHAGFPVVAGAPPEGIICALPSIWTPRSRSLVFKLKLSKSGATESEVPIHQILHRSRPPHDDTSDEADAPSAEGVVPLAAAPPELVAAAGAADGMAGGMAGGVGGSVPNIAACHAVDVPPTERDASEHDAVQASIRSNHLDTNVLPPVMRDVPSTLAGAAREVLCRSSVPLAGEGEAAVELPSVGVPPKEHAEQMAAVQAAADVREAVEDKAEDEAAEAVVEAAEDEMVEAAEEAGGGDAEVGNAEEMASAVPPVAPAHAASSLDHEEGTAIPAIPAPLEGAAESAAEPEAQALAPRRERKRKQRYGDAGELEGAARSFFSAPPPPKPFVDPSFDMGVPACTRPRFECGVPLAHDRC